MTLQNDTFFFFYKLTIIGIKIWNMQTIHGHDGILDNCLIVMQNKIADQNPP